MFFEYLNQLCIEKGITVSRLMQELDLSKSSASRWKHKGYKPELDAAKKIADYFGIEVTELLNCGQKKPALTNENELSDVDKELIERLRRATPEQIQRVRDFVAGVIK